MFPCPPDIPEFTPEFLLDQMEWHAVYAEADLARSLEQGCQLFGFGAQRE